MLAIRGVCAALTMLLIQSAAGQSPPGWLPENVEENAAADFARTVSALGIGKDKSEEEMLIGGRKMIGDIRSRLESLGRDGVIALAPEIPSYPFPAPADPGLAAMAKFALCRFPVEVVANDETLVGQEARQRFAATIYMFLLDLTNIYLRMHYYAQGGTEPEIKEALTGEPMDGIAATIQTDAAAGQTVMNECAPRLGELLTGQ